MSKKYKTAFKEEGYWEHTFIVTKTDCINDKGHKWEWVFRNDPEHDEILKEHPRFKGIGIVKCRHCGKVKSTH